MCQLEAERETQHNTNVIWNKKVSPNSRPLFYSWCDELVSWLSHVIWPVHFKIS